MAPPTDERSSLGELIAQRRIELGLTKSEAARRAHIARGTWHDLEGGKRVNVLTSTLHHIDEALDWEPGTLRSMLATPLDLELETADYVARARRRLIELASTLSGEEVRRVVFFAESGGDILGQLEDIQRAVAAINQQEGRRRREHPRSRQVAG